METRTFQISQPRGRSSGLRSGAEELGYVFAPIPGGAEHPLFRYDPVTGEVVYYLQDSMGSVIGLVDQTATQTARIEYDGFGRERSATGALATLPVAGRGDFRFHGMWLDAGVGLYYVRARVYDAGVGRFLSNDPAEGRRATPESFDGSRFVRNGPFLRRDPGGRQDILQQMASLTISNVLQGVAANVIPTALVNWRRWQCNEITGEEYAGLLLHAGLYGALVGLLSTVGQIVLNLLITGLDLITREDEIFGTVPHRAAELAGSFWEWFVGWAPLLGELALVRILTGQPISEEQVLNIVHPALIGLLGVAADVLIDAGEGGAGEIGETLVNIIGNHIAGTLNSEIAAGPGC